MNLLFCNVNLDPLCMNLHVFMFMNLVMYAYLWTWTCELRPLLYGFVELMWGVQGVYIFLFFKYADNVVRFVKLVHQIYWLLLPLFNYQNAMFHSQVYLWYLCFSYLTLCSFIFFLCGTTCCWYIEGHICHFRWHLTLLLYQMDRSAIYGRNFQVDAR